MAWPTDQVAVGDLITAAQLNRLSIMLADSTLGAAAASFDLTSIPAHWSHLLLVCDLRGDTVATATDVRLRFNNDSGANYDRQQIVAFGTTVSGGEGIAGTSAVIGSAPAASAPASVSGPIAIWVPNYASTTFQKAVSTQGGDKLANSTGNVRFVGAVGFWRNAAAINRITVLPGAGNFDTGSRVSLYGMGRI